jgi:hypothetical protein
MIRFPLAAALVGLAVTIAGCADMRWSKPGADAALVSRDLDECRAAALRSANAPISTPGQVDARTDGMSGPGIMTPAAGSNERFVAEHEEVSRCMLQRGYQLKPAP